MLIFLKRFLLQTMAEIKRKILKDETHAGKNSFLLTVICHGNDKGHLLDKDKKRAWILEDFIKDLSLVDTLIGKPKILVLQACRGGITYSKSCINCSHQNCFTAKHVNTKENQHT